MVDSVVDNFSMRTQRRAELKLEFSAKTNTAELENFILSVKKLLEEKKEFIEKFSVFFSDYNKNGVTVTIEYFTIHFSMTEFNQLKETINIGLKKQIESMGLEMASAGNDINIFSGDASAGQAKSQPII